MLFECLNGCSGGGGGRERNDDSEGSHHNLWHDFLLLTSPILILILIARRDQSPKHVSAPKHRAGRGRGDPPPLRNVLGLDRRPCSVRRTVRSQPWLRSLGSRLRGWRWRKERGGLNLDGGRARDRRRGFEARVRGCWRRRGELCLVFCDDRKHDLLVRVVRFDDFPTAPAISKSVQTTSRSTRTSTHLLISPLPSSC